MIDALGRLAVGRIEQSYLAFLGFDRAARKAGSKLSRVERHGLLGPMRKIGARRVAPMHRPVARAMRVVLEECVIDAVHDNQPIGVVHPAGTGRQMERRSKLLNRGHWTTP